MNLVNENSEEKEKKSVTRGLEITVPVKIQQSVVHGISQEAEI